MALDNAQFMSELSIVDPPGTDPLSEGDDQIRTSKRTQQQSFPNVDKAVTLTADQLNLAAIKNESNVFTVPQLFADGTAGLPGISFANQTDMGLFNLGVNQMGIGTNGGLQVTVNNNFVNFAPPIRGAAGTEAQPSYSFVGDTNSGMYSLAADIIGFAVLGAERFRIASNAVSTFAPNMRMTVSDTAAGSAKIEFGVLTDNSGFYQSRTGAGVVSFVVRSDLNDASSYVNAGSLVRPRFGVGTSSPGATLHVAGPGGLASTLRVTGLPLTNAGLVSGDCFESSGFIAIVP